MEEKVRRYSIGSLFAGIGGFELGLERAIPGAFTLWQVEQNNFCQKVLAKHWPQAQIYDDVKNINKNNVEQVDILCGGFPCQDISIAGKGEGLNGEKSNLYWQLHRIIDELQPKAVIMENVPVISIRGLGTVLGSLSEIGYDAEWCTIRASDFGAPHKRERWFCIAYPSTVSNSRWTPTHSKQDRKRTSNTIQTRRETSNAHDIEGISPYSSKERFRNDTSSEIQFISKSKERTETPERTKHSPRRVFNTEGNYWERFPIESPLCRRNDGIPNRLDRIAALGNAIVPQCSEWIGRKLWESGILQAGEYNGKHL